MSTNQQRLKSAIQRIARSDPQIRSLLKAVETRGSIPGSSASASNDAEQDRQCCDGSVANRSSDDNSSSDATVGTETRMPDDSNQNGLKNDNTANLDGMDGGSLDGLVDCNTGVPIRFDGSDWIPPEGWDSPTEPGTDPSYQEGKYYYIYNPFEGGKSGRSPTKGGAISQAALTPGGTRYGVSYDACYGLTEVDEEDSRYGDKTCGGTSYLGGIWVNVEHRDCNGSTADYCNPSDDDVTMDSWPEDGVVSLAVKNGAIVGSKYDPENDGAYSKGKSEISLCDENGNEVNIKPNATGGWKSIDPAVNGGDGYMYDITGKRIARISGSEYSDPNI